MIKRYQKVCQNDVNVIMSWHPRKSWNHGVPKVSPKMSQKWPPLNIQESPCNLEKGGQKEGPKMSTLKSKRPYKPKERSEKSDTEIDKNRKITVFVKKWYPLFGGQISMRTHKTRFVKTGKKGVFGPPFWAQNDPFLIKNGDHLSENWRQIAKNH